MAVSEQVVTELIIDARGAEVGAAVFTRSMAGAGKAAQDATASADKMAASVEKSTMVYQRATPSIERITRQYQDLQAKMDPAFASTIARQREFERATRITEAAVKVGRAGIDDSASVLQRYRQHLDGAAVGSTKLATSNDNVAKAANGSAYAVKNLGFQVNDMATMLASGSSPMQVLATQGGQVLQIYQETPSVFGDFARSVGSVLTPARLATAGVLAIGAAAAYAFSSWTDEQRELSRALTGTGRDAGITLTSLNAIGEATARARGGSGTDNRATVAALAGTGRIDSAMLGPIAGVRRDLSATLGIDAAEANKLLAGSFADPARGAEQLNQSLGGLSQTTRDYIRYLSTSGNEQRAQQVMLDAITPRLGRASELTSVWARAWEKVKSTASDALDSTGRGLERLIVKRPVDPLQEAQERLAEMERGGGVDHSARQRGDWSGMNALGGSGGFGVLVEGARAQGDAVRKVNVELEIQRLAVNAIRVGQEALTSATERQATAEARVSRNNRVRDEAVTSARRQGQPEQRGSDDIRGLIEDFEAQRRERELKNETANGSPEYYEARRRQEATSRALRSRLTNGGAGLFGIGVDGNLNFRSNLYGAPDEHGNRALKPESFDAIQARRQTPIDDMNDRASVERMEREARTVKQRQDAAAARARLNAQDQGAGAGTPDQVNASVRIARDREQQQATFQLTQAARERINSANDNIATLRAETAAMGGSIAVQERVRMEQQLLTDAKREYRRLGLTIPQEEIDAIKRAADEMGRYRQQQALGRLNQDIAFDRRTMGMPDSERQIAGSMRQIHGDSGWQSQMQSVEAQQLRVNSSLRQGSEYASSFFQDLYQGARQSKGGFDFILQAFTRMLDRMIMAQLDAMAKGLFNFGGGGGMGGFNPLGAIGGMFGMGGGPMQLSGSMGGGGMVTGMGMDTGAFSPFAMLDVGGYTGAGSRHQAAGIVHRNEIVWSQPDISRAGGVDVVEGMRRGLRGYADGGPVASYVPPSANSNFRMQQAASQRAGFSGNVIVNNNGQPVSATARPDGQGNLVIDMDAMADGMEARSAAKISRRDSPVANAMAGNYGLQQKPVVG